MTSSAYKLPQAIRGRRLRPVLEATPGLRLTKDHCGCYEAEGEVWDVHMDGGDGMRLSMPWDDPMPAREALELTSGLRGNVRFADLHGVVSLMADTQLDGMSHLTSTFGEVAGCARLLRKSGKVAPADTSAFDEELGGRVSDAVSGLGWPDDSAVHLEDDGAWELRPRLQGVTQPVRLTQQGDALRMHRKVLRSPRRASKGKPADPHAESITKLAMHLNAQIRLARITLRGECLDVEALLRSELVTPFWLGETARAIAVAAAHAKPSLTVLSTDRRVAESYLATLA